MLKVILKHDAFINNTFYSSAKGAVLIPEDQKDKLPSTAKIVGEGADERKENTPQQAYLRDLDSIRASEDFNTAFKKNK